MAFSFPWRNAGADSWRNRVSVSARGPNDPVRGLHAAPSGAHLSKSNRGMSRNIPTGAEANQMPAATISREEPDGLARRRGKLLGSLDTAPPLCDSVRTIGDAALGDAARPAGSTAHGTCDPFRRFRRQASPPGLPMFRTRWTGIRFLPPTHRPNRSSEDPECRGSGFATGVTGEPAGCTAAGRSRCALPLLPLFSAHAEHSFCHFPRQCDPGRCAAGGNFRESPGRLPASKTRPRRRCTGLERRTKSAESS